MHKLQNLRLVVCDMAGTTVNDDHEVEYCFSLAAQQSGLEMSDQEILAVQGWAKRKVFETFWERQVGARDATWTTKVEASYGLFRDILEEHYLSNAILPTEGAVELFSFLKEKEIPVALTTGFYRKVADIILNKLGWLNEGLVQWSVTSDEVEQGRPDPDMIRRVMQHLELSNPKQVINIGDTPSDIQSGKNAGVLLSCCVTNGTHSAEKLNGYEPDLSFASLYAFKEFLQAQLDNG